MTPKKRAKALAIIADTGSCRKAAQVVKVSFQAIYKATRNDPGFAEAFKNALAEYQDKLEEECDRRAVEGTDHPVTYEGRITDTYKEYSDTLLMFRLKAIAPEKYRDNHHISGEIGVKVDDLFARLAERKKALYVSGTKAETTQRRHEERQNRSTLTLV